MPKKQKKNQITFKTLSPSPPAVSSSDLLTMAEGYTSIKPPTLSGGSEDDPDQFIKYFDRYVTYREITDEGKKRNLLAVLFTKSAADWFDSLDDSSKDTYNHLRSAFEARYQLADTLQYKSAAELFTRKQLPNESCDDYIVYMRKLARIIKADDNILRFANIG